MWITCRNWWSYTFRTDHAHLSFKMIHNPRTETMQHIIQRRPLPCFALLAFAITWSI
jgi:hypothetical protein